MSHVALFAGPGGGCTGAAALGLTGLGIEWDQTACDTAEAAGHERLKADIAGLNPRDFGRPEGLTGTPPCQGFSLAGKGRGRDDSLRLIAAVDELAAGRDPRDDLHESMKDDRSVLALEPLRWSLDLLPEWLFWEQVPAVLPLWTACGVALQCAGYSVWTGYVNAERYGVPQTRKRAVLIASRNRLVDMPAPTHSKYHVNDRTKLDPGVLPWISMAEAIGRGMTQRPSMTVTGGGTATGGAEPFGNAARQGMRRELEAGRWLPDWCHTSPAPTVAGDPRIAPRGCKHPREGCCSKWDGTPGLQFGPGTVRVSVAEAACLQSFPDSYPWQGKQGAQFRQVGDAVPPVLAMHAISEATGIPVPVTASDREEFVA